MKSKLIAGLTLVACLFLVTGCENPVQKVVDKAKDKVETSVDEKVKNTTDKVKNDVKKVVDSATVEKLTCTMTEENNSMKMEMKINLDYDTKANQPKNISMEMNMKVGAEVIEVYKSTGLDFCESFQTQSKISGKCTSTVSTDSVKLNYEINETEMSKLIEDADDSKVHTFAELKAAFEKEGFKCN